MERAGCFAVLIETRLRDPVSWEKDGLKTEPRLVDRGKSKPMVGTRAMFPKHGKMVCRGIAAMAGKAVLGKLTINLVHHPIAGHFGKDAGSGDAEAQPIPPHQGSLLHRQSLDGKSIDQRMGRGMTLLLQPLQGTAHGKMCRPKDIELTNFFSTSLRYGVENLNIFCKPHVQLFPLPVIELLGVIQPLQGKPLGQDDGRGHHGAGQGPPPRLIDSRNGTDPAGMKLLFVKKRRAP